MGHLISRRPEPATVRRYAAVATVCAAVWLVLTGGAASMLVPGIAVAAAAAGLVVLAVPSPGPESGPRSGPHLSPIRFLAWIPGFLWRALAGAVDVSGRVLAPRLNITPRLTDIPTSTPDGWPRALFTGVVSLVPGSLTAGSAGDRVRVHVLVDDPSIVAGVHEEERRIRHMTRGSLRGRR
ncbi:Na+/H+ antiporter subunit E [Fodinicurvata sp. EGI_FJ10296]|uniref:Na+/H+ antiporter subunit E n=1 Tax=Fodinicurvata sp. EGI_FJ10296 TaxID=3231908 RepID=UPI0034567AFD